MSRQNAQWMMNLQSTEWNTLRRDRSSPDPEIPSLPNVKMRSRIGDEQSRRVPHGVAYHPPKGSRTQD
ncbi:hypothetical protein PF008_g21872 [Phytophthora fragariae]|uniref:Uncharacterized protein n=2 Tax=Phytophthora TaxID=4783 RepID=A0A6A3J947_9STRA|nr:hypothetical protein PR002_g21195 [Phytophthora rubi]KAE9304854.1 hypothetical protein PF008_g21872 [Phytophthora fragariae]